MSLYRILAAPALALVALVVGGCQGQGGIDPASKGLGNR